MKIINLEPDEFELLLASQKGHLKACPHCGRSPLMMTGFREDTGIYKATVFCSDWRCGANIFYTAEDKETARKRAIEKWEKRVPDKERDEAHEAALRYNDQARHWKELAEFQIEVLKYAERIVDYFANDRTFFEGPGNPKDCLAYIHKVLARAEHKGLGRYLAGKGLIGDDKC